MKMMMTVETMYERDLLLNSFAAFQDIAAADLILLKYLMRSTMKNDRLHLNDDHHQCGGGAQILLIVQLLHLHYFVEFQERLPDSKPYSRASYFNPLRRLSIV